MKELLFYDIEVFKHDSIVVFKDINKKYVGVFHNNFKGMKDLIKGKTLVGFNNYHYDDKVLTYMLNVDNQKHTQFLIKELNDKIIAGEKVKYIGEIPFKSLDVFQQCDVSNPSLKKIEGNMGRMILESSVPFTIETPLTKKQVRKSIKYCSYDVDSTIDIYLLREKSYFQPKQSLLDMLGNEKAARWNTTTISANLLLEKPLPKWESVKIPPDMWLVVPEEVRELWIARSKYWSKPQTADKHIEIEDFDCTIQFGFGGLHGAHKTIKREKKVKLLDVKSMYPMIILILKVLGEEATEKYKKILDKRLAIKYIDEILSEALKLILNSVFGNLNQPYSKLFNPMALMSVCLFGQIALYDLCKRLAPFTTILNINTDGVAFIPHDERYILAYKDWEKEYSLELDEKNFDLLVQKDVNNYIAVQEDGKMICKGGDVNRYKEDAFFKNNNARILDIALCEYLINGKDIYGTIYENADKPQLFQYILKAGGTYKGTFDEAGNEYNKVNRVFASKKEGFCLYKKRFDDGLVRFADAPVNMHLENGDCNEIKNFHEIVDLNHYYQIVTKRIERWI